MPICHSNLMIILMVLWYPFRGMILILFKFKNCNNVDCSSDFELSSTFISHLQPKCWQICSKLPIKDNQSFQVVFLQFFILFSATSSSNLPFSKLLSWAERELFHCTSLSLALGHPRLYRLPPTLEKSEN